MLQKARWDTVRKRLPRRRKAKVTTQRKCTIGQKNGPKKLFGEKELHDDENRRKTV